ncbi:MAG: hypothetical protein E7437_09645 [Ruminococcaceae bacterium]|nr:hypothetical protein [Oscillospiraceae bacterium]
MSIPIHSSLQLIFSFLIIALTYLFMHLEYKDRNSANGQIFYEKPATIPYRDLIFLILYTCLFAVILYRGFHGSGVDFLGKIIGYALYTIIFTLAFPFLKKRCSARFFTSLFLIPAIPFLIRTYSYDPLIQLPIYEIHLSISVFYIWFVGMILILLWYVGSHLRFRRYILKGAIRIVDPRVTNLWVDELEEHGTGDYIYPIVYSRQIHTPLTIGLFRKTLYIVLPYRAYTQEELSMILRHEFIHIMRNDQVCKLQMALVNAVFWFNPMSWLLTKRYGEIIEIRCDEEVLSGTDPQYRKKYAQLLLTNTANSRGFSTCLSSSAKSFMFRIQRIMKPIPQKSGILLCTVFIAIGILLITSIGAKPINRNDYESIATVEEFMWLEEPYEIQEIRILSSEETYKCYTPIDESEILNYIYNLDVSKKIAETGIFTYPYLKVSMKYENLLCEIDIKDNYVGTIVYDLSINDAIQARIAKLCYKVDYTYLESLMKPLLANPE